LLNTFLDDYTYPFKVNPQFKAWVPVVQVPNCWLWIDGVSRPKLWFYAPLDYWHSVQPLPDAFWTAEVDIIALAKADDIASQLPNNLQRVAYIGYGEQRAKSCGIKPENINPKPVLDYLHYHRAYKTGYELACMREAQKIAVNGHIAAKEAFYSDMSEFDINLAYLAATGQQDSEVPYGNIVAINEHSAVLHYTALQHQPPAELHSFLIDAGAEFNGYAADITRSYSAKNDSEFAELVKNMHSEQQALIATVKTGVNYLDYHVQMHHRVANLLKAHKLVAGMSEEAMVAQNLTGPFLPHGLGHPLGLQVHDVGGFMQDDHGTHLAAPDKYPYLRCTRVLQPGMVMTIEPGIYFIDSLLAPWRQGGFSKYFDWQRIDRMKIFGGVRIEDNIVIHETYIENMTRDLKLS
jgi:Xaa-Pro dipeptidase